MLSSPYFRQFYLDDLSDELTITALQMLVKDLLILFQAVNEGVINVLGKVAIIPTGGTFLPTFHSFRTLL